MEPAREVTSLSGEVPDLAPPARANRKQPPVLPPAPPIREEGKLPG
jgi:hypothetical protein